MPVKAPVKAPLWQRTIGLAVISVPTLATVGDAPAGTLTHQTCAPILPGSFPISQNLNGVIGGGQIGCNRQFDSRWVLGIEADFQGSAEKHSNSFSDPFAIVIGEGGVSGVLSQTIEAKIQWFGTVRGRAGFLISPTLMLYGTGGLAYGKVSATDNFFQLSLSISAGGRVTATTTESIGDSKTKVGWTLGPALKVLCSTQETGPGRLNTSTSISDL